MKYVLKNQEMQDVDKETIQQIGMPGLVLMERASEKIARRLMETVRKSDRILSVAGCGNNGGDALAAARILLEEGFCGFHSRGGAVQGIRRFKDAV